MRVSQLISITAFLVTFVFAEGEAVNPTTPAVPERNPTYQEIEADLNTAWLFATTERCQRYTDEYAKCPSGCVNYRFNCLITSSNYAECVPMKQCEAKNIIYIVLGSLFGLCCLGGIISMCIASKKGEGEA